VRRGHAVFAKALCGHLPMTPPNVPEARSADTGGTTRERFADLRVEAERFAREKPLQALLTAFGIGFIVGNILRR
jgi:ElaB/YqjD/DUF883 family membrane-anchored ribosome-binding protein